MDGWTDESTVKGGIHRKRPCVRTDGLCVNTSSSARYTLEKSEKLNSEVTV